MSLQNTINEYVPERGVNERGPVINQGPHQIPSQAMKEVWVLVLRLFFIFLSAVSPGFSVV